MKNTESLSAIKCSNSQFGHPKEHQWTKSHGLLSPTSPERLSLPSAQQLSWTESIFAPVRSLSRLSSEDGAGGGGGVAAPAALPLPCLLLTTAPAVQKNKSAIAKKAECLHVNL